MVRIPENVITEIKSNTNIVDVISQYVGLEKRGKNYLGLCPFHQEKTPSFNVIEEKQFFHCFGCGKGGDVFTFLREMENISYPEAIAKVAEIGHIPFSYSTTANNTQPQNTEKKELIDIHEKACEIYIHVLKNLKIGENALSYLKNRGLTDDTLEMFRVGFAPEERNFLSKVFLKQGKSKEILLKTGLFIETNSGELVDRFSGRIMFPIRNAYGEVVAFSGRKVFTQEEAEKNPELKKNKYMNSPESEIFNKSQLLFNFDLAKQVIRKQEEVFLFEGQMDVIASTQAGITNGVASLGTSLTEMQINQLARVTKNVITVFDGDNAGLKATNRAIDLFEKFPKLTLQTVTLTDGLDPDDFIRTHGEDDFRKILKNGRSSWFEFRKKYLKVGRNLENKSEQIAYINQLLQELTKIVSMIEVDVYINELSNEFPNFSYAVLMNQLKELQKKNAPVQREEYVSQNEPVAPPAPERYDTPPQERNLSKIEKAEQQLLYRIFYQGVAHRFANLLEGFHFYHESYESLYVLYQGYERQMGDFDSGKFLTLVQREDLSSIATEILMKTWEAEVEENEILDLISVIRDSSNLEEKILKLKEEFHQATQSGNTSLAKQLLNQVVQLKASM